MKVLILGNSNSFWVKEFIKNVMVPLNVDIYIYGNNKSTFNEYHDNEKFHIVDKTPSPKWIMHIPKVRAFISLINQRNDLNNYAPFDIIINIFVSFEMLLLASLLKEKNTRIYSYFCGSDIIRSSRLNCLKMTPLLRKMDKIIFASNNVKYYFEQKFTNKIQVSKDVIRFGITSFNFMSLKLLAHSKSSIKQSLNIDEKKTTVAIGYNASKSQNHLKVLNELLHVPQEFMEKIIIVLQMNYGGDKKYIEKVLKAVNKLNCESKIFQEYMNLDEITNLRLSTDIFINAQSTDGLSASVLEALYSGAELINAKWLNYREYKEWGISHYSFLNYSSIPEILVKILKNPRENFSETRNVLDREMSWKNSLESWGKNIF